MRKTLLLASLITTVSMASTGFVESNFKGDLNFTKADDMTVLTGNLDELSLKGEVKVNKLTLGAILKNKDIKEISKVKPLTTEMYTENLLDNSSVYAKYELPEFSGIKSYVKGTLNPKAKYEADGTLNFKKGNVELEGQLAHSFSNGAEVSLTSKTTFPFEKKDGEYGKAASSEHTLKLGAKKLNNFEDLETSLKVNHTYAKEEAFKFVELLVKGTYAGLKDTKLTGKANFRYQVNGTSDVKDLLTDGQIKLNKYAYAHSYELDAKYTGVKDLELTAGAFVQHIHFDEGGVNENSLEKLYTQSLISNDPNFITNSQLELAEIEKEYKEALKDLESKSSTKEQVYRDANTKYEQELNVLKTESDNEDKKIKKDYNDFDEEKEDAKKGYDIQVKINNLEKKAEELESAKRKLENDHNFLKTKVKSKYINEEKYQNEMIRISEEIEEIGAQIAKLTLSFYDTNNIFGPSLHAIVGGAVTAGKDFAIAENNVKKFEENKEKFIAEKIMATEYGIALNKVKELEEKIEQTRNGIINSVNIQKYNSNLVNFGFKLGAKYTGVKNLTLTADGVFAGRYHSLFDKTIKYTTGYVKLHTGAKYDYKLLNDKLVVSPEGNVTTTFADIYAGLCNPSLVLAPKVSVSYKPVDALNVSGSVEVPVNFGRTGINDFGYQITSIKSALNMRYEWK
ncbi:hypothetical protein ABZU05_05960 [Sneathia vaginalis]|uniref:hypothetical protein n=1 Tax=Sneathia vaginalis TaxID=187101 RepID=UPI0035C682EB